MHLKGKNYIILTLDVHFDTIVYVSIVYTEYQKISEKIYQISEKLSVVIYFTFSKEKVIKLQ